MLILSFFQWWFTRGWSRQFANIERRAYDIIDSYSFPILLRTMFKPWKQMVSDRGTDKSLNSYFRMWLDNAVSRFVGFWVRFFTLLAATLLLLLSTAYSTAIALVWPLLPAAPIILLFISMGAI